MKKKLEDDIMLSIMPFIDHKQMSDVKLAITAALGPYEVKKTETTLTVYEGDINEMILRRFLSAKLAAGCSKRTIEFYRNSIRLSLEKIGKPFMDVTADDLRLYFATRIYQDGVSKTTTNNERRNLSSFYAWLQVEEILMKNPMLKVPPIKDTKKKKQAFSQMDIEKMRLNCATKRETAIFEMLLSTWCRVSEIAQVKIEDIHTNRLIVHGKGDKDREVYLNARAQLAIEEYLKERSDSNPYLFPKARYAGDMKSFAKGIKRKEEKLWYQNPDNVSDDEHMNQGTIEEMVRKIGKKAGVVNAHPHRFRRTGATTALRNGMPLIQVSKMLGHENIGTTQIYLDISDEELMQAHQKYVV